ncbi:MAG: sigma-70 family RNA polymerase sigma factor [Planctomycetes bacterium]|nr:sigma-70 family RNA polymerase sigma factor [Planctomycetota bacterium]
MAIGFLSSRSDAALVRRSLRNIPEAFECLIRRHQRSAYGIARSFGIHAASADDVVQEAFVRAFAELRSLREPARFGAWFLAIVRNAARRHIRDAGRLPGKEAWSSLPAWPSCVRRHCRSISRIPPTPSSSVSRTRSVEVSPRSPYHDGRPGGMPEKEAKAWTERGGISCGRGGGSSARRRVRRPGRGRCGSARRPWRPTSGSRRGGSGNR